MAKTADVKQALQNVKEPVGLPALNFTRDQVDLIKSTVAKGTTDNELALFLYAAKRTGLDPLVRQIHAVKRGGQMAIQTGIDGYRLIADRTGRYAPGKVTWEFDGDKIVSATATVKKLVGETWHEIEATAYFDEYKVDVGPMWKKMPKLMIAKCAEALAIRRAFPSEVSGVYTNEEMQQADNNVVDVTPTVVDSDTTNTTASVPVEKTTPTNGKRSRQNPEKPISDKQRKRLFAISKGAGKTNEQVKDFLLNNYKIESTSDILVKDYEAICEWAEKGDVIPTRQVDFEEEFTDKGCIIP